MEHLPVNPIRRHHREILFSAAWSALMNKEPEKHQDGDPDWTQLHDIIPDYPFSVEQREAA